MSHTEDGDVHLPEGPTLSSSLVCQEADLGSARSPTEGCPVPNLHAAQRAPPLHHPARARPRVLPGLVEGHGGESRAQERSGEDGRNGYHGLHSEHRRQKAHEAWLSLKGSPHRRPPRRAGLALLLLGGEVGRRVITSRAVGFTEAGAQTGPWCRCKRPGPDPLPLSPPPAGHGPQMLRTDPLG